MSQAERYHTRADIPVNDVDEERKADLRTAFDAGEDVI